MKKYIHILGASGSGTTTLGKELARTLGHHHLDTDDFYWETTQPPFSKPRELKERQALLNTAMEKHETWVISGSLVGWGDQFIPKFDLVIFLWIPSDLRIARLHKRERLRYGSEIEAAGEMHQSFIEFIDWASHYDTGDTSIRSRKLHEEWMATLECDLIRLEGKYELREKIDLITKQING